MGLLPAAAFDDASLKVLAASLPQLNCLQLGETAIQSSGQHLSRLTALTQLDVSHTPVDCSILSALTGLRRLSLRMSTGLSEAGLPVIAQLRGLTYLDVSYAPEGASPSALGQLTQLRKLKRLGVLGHTLRAESLQLLDLPELCTLSAHRIAAQQHDARRGSALTHLMLNDPTTQQLDALLPLPSLQSLALYGQPAISSSIAAQTQLTRLGMVRIAEADPAAVCSVLQALKQLQVLDLGAGVAIDRECMVAIAALPQLQELGLSCRLPDASLGLLQRCSLLRTLVLQRCADVTSSDVVWLVSKPGMQKVVLAGREGLTQQQIGPLSELGLRYGCKLVRSVSYVRRLACFASDDEFVDMSDEESEDEEQDGDE